MCFDRRICLSHASVGSVRLSVCSAIYRRSHTSLTELLHVTQDKKGFISRTGPALVYQRAVTPVRSPWLFPFKTCIRRPTGATRHPRMRLTMSMSVLAAALLCGALAQEGEIDCKSMKVKQLRQMLAARGVKCEGCAEKVPRPRP